MKHSNKLAAVALGVLGAGLVSGLVTAPALAAPGTWGEEQHFDWGEIVEDFCDVPGMTVEDVGSGVSQAKTIVRGGVEVELGRNLDTDVYTNLGNGRSVTNVQDRNDQLYFTDNGDGTYTVHYFAVGTNTAYDDTGTVIARDSGSIRVENVWDQMGTPEDDSDDEFLSHTVLRSTGHRYDFCAVLVPALT